MRKLIITLAIFLSSVLLFANPYNLNGNVGGQELSLDTISNASIVGGAVTLCQQKSCIDTLLKKIEAFEPQSYMIMYRISKTSYVLEQKESRIKEILKTYNASEMSIMDGDISINSVKYNVKHLVILQ